MPPTAKGKSKLVQTTLTKLVRCKKQPDPRRRCKHCRQTLKECVYQKFFKRALLVRFKHYHKHFVALKTTGHIPPMMPMMWYGIRDLVRLFAKREGDPIGESQGTLPLCAQFYIDVVDFTGHDKINFSPRILGGEPQKWTFTDEAMDIMRRA